MIGIEEDFVRFAHSGPSQRFLRGLRPLVSVGHPPATRVRGWTRLLNPYHPLAQKICTVSGNFPHFRAIEVFILHPQTRSRRFSCSIG